MLITLIIAALLSSLTKLSNGFSTDFQYSLASFSTDSTDHQEITQAAALIVLRNYLLDNPNTEVNSTSAINDLQDLSIQSLFQAYYLFESKGALDLATIRYTDIVNIIKEANADVDDSEGSLPEAHFDDEKIPEGNNRILVKRQTIVNSIKAGLYEVAQKETGRALHTLQDFYSHSNWVELGNTDPHEGLGRPGGTLSNLAGERLKTCISCQQGDAMGRLFNFIEGAVIGVDREYDCRDNLIENQVLTTGYYSHTPNYTKPKGKCSHGGPGDRSSRDPTAKGGINKDLKSGLHTITFMTKQ